MDETPSIDLTSVIVSVAGAVKEANRILSEGSDAPMGITEFTVQYKVHASLYVQPVKANRLGLRPTESGLVVIDRPTLPIAQLHHMVNLTPKERILTGYQHEADLTITTKMEPLPNVE